MTFVSEDMTITTWGSVDGNQRWRVRAKDGREAEFFADRLTEVGLLFDLALDALGDGCISNPPENRQRAHQYDGDENPCSTCGHPAPDHYAWSTECARIDGSISTGEGS